MRPISDAKESFFFHLCFYVANIAATAAFSALTNYRRKSGCSHSRTGPLLQKKKKKKVLASLDDQPN